MITSLKDSSGNWITDCHDIGQLFVQHFSSIFSTQQVSPLSFWGLADLFSEILTPDDKISLSSIPSEKEIFDALHSMNPTKAQGLMS